MNLDDDDTVDELPARPRKEIPEEDFVMLAEAARAIHADIEEVEGEGYANLHFANGSTLKAWNPLVHNDDALDLMVRLHFTVEVLEAAVVCKGVIGMRKKGTLDEHRHEFARESLGEDPNGATRRAITRAAAQIIRGNKFLSETS